MTNNLFGYPDGVVYLIKYGNENIYKIGSTKRMTKRLCELKITVPIELHLLHTIYSDDHKWLERYWHEHFKKKRLTGSGIRRASEWFRLTKDDVSEFTKHKEPVFKPKHQVEELVNLFADDQLRQAAIRRVIKYYDELARSHPEYTSKLAPSCVWQISEINMKTSLMQDLGHPIDEAIKFWEENAYKAANKKLIR